METDPTQESTDLIAGPAWSGARADTFLFHELPSVSRTRIRQKVLMGEARLNGHRFSTSTRLRPGDRITVSWRSVPAGEAGPDFPILLEDPYLLLVDKPAGAATHPAGSLQSGTVVQFARRHAADRIQAGLERGDASFYPTVVNRLDRSTSGIVVIALDRDTHRALQVMAGRREIHREYLALVEGTIPRNEGEIDLPLGFSPDSAVRLKMTVRADGRPSLTRYEVVEHVADHTLVRVFPVSGRQHQIRVHFAAIGHPVAGDLLYKDERRFLSAQEERRRAGPGARQARHALHAERVRFRHPVSGAEIDVWSAPPEDFLEMVRAARGGPGRPRG